MQLPSLERELERLRGVIAEDWRSSRPVGRSFWLRLLTHLPAIVALERIAPLLKRIAAAVSRRAEKKLGVEIFKVSGVKLSSSEIAELAELSEPELEKLLLSIFKATNELESE